MGGGTSKPQSARRATISPATKPPVQELTAAERAEEENAKFSEMVEIVQVAQPQREEDNYTSDVVRIVPTPESMGATLLSVKDANELNEAAKSDRVFTAVQISGRRMTTDSTETVNNLLKKEGNGQILYLDFTVPGASSMSSKRYGIRSADLASLLNGLEKNASVQSLVFDGNFLGDNNASQLARMLKHNKTLTHVDLRLNSIHSSSSSSFAIPLRLPTCNIRLFSLEYNSIDCTGIVPLVDKLPPECKLQYLNLKGNHIGDAGISAIASALKGPLRLIRLDLHGNKIGPNGAVALAEALGPKYSLRYLDISSNQIETRGGAAIGAALKHNTTLQYLNVSSNSIETEGITEIANSLCTNKTLTYLNISDNPIHHTVASAISGALRANSTLRTLIMRGNDIAGIVARTAHIYTGQDGGKVAIKNAASSVAGLDQLQYYNALGGPGVSELARALMHNKTLKELDISMNWCGVPGAASLSLALSTNASLRKLYFAGNFIGPEGSRRLLEGLAKSSSLIFVDLSCNVIGEEGLNRLFYLQKKKPDLQLKLDHNTNDEISAPVSRISSSP
eukprot:TRINITY_DN654_c0_g2_i4.p1 TRINITY_DN654_c0_g2~~TRINITY_DN654_c0_g2_i4.p1  ORF type:complete len:565 (-),score=120.04 TRINITY_DN654_c0_g2_i4:370-2064(-)